jgi:hypothetical protein
MATFLIPAVDLLYIARANMVREQLLTPSL